MVKGPLDIANKLPRSVKAAAMAGALVLSALLTALALRSADLHWLAWISFLPLFAAVRSLRCPIPSSGAGRKRGVPHFCAARSQIPIHREWGTHGSAKRPRLANPSPTCGEGGVPAAALAGGFWGGCLYLFCSAGSPPAVDTVARAFGLSACAAQAGLSLWLLALLIVIPAVYVSLAARRTWPMGYKLLTLAFGWVLLEVILVTTYTNTPEPRTSARAVLQNQDYSYSLHQALLTGSHGEAPYVHSLARLVGYICTALVVACANATLVSILSGAHLRFPPCRSLARSAIAFPRLPSQVVLAIQSWTLRQAYPRPPPIPVPVPRWNLVGSAHPTKLSLRPRKPVRPGRTTRKPWCTKRRAEPALQN